ncbi:MAG: thioredoxin family protein [Gemmatimonadota bacterium]
MKTVKVLGSGCNSCKVTAKLIADVAEQKGIAVTVEKVEEIRDIMAYGVISTPGVVIDERVVHAGGVPSRAKVEGWLS